MAHRGPKNTTASGRHLPDRSIDAVDEAEQEVEDDDDGGSGRMSNLTRRRLRAAHGI